MHSCIGSACLVLPVQPCLARENACTCSVDLCLAIESVFFALSNFSQAHQLLLDNQVGAVTLEVIDLELQRADHREEVGRSAMLRAGWRAGGAPGPMEGSGNAASASVLVWQSTQWSGRVVWAAA